MTTDEKKHDVEVKVLHFAGGPVTLRADCGCALCRRYFGQQQRPDSRESSTRTERARADEAR